MAKTYKVGILGNQDGNDQMFFSGKYGVEVFDLTADQICNFLEHPDIDQSVQASRTDFPAPTMKYEVMGGGRFYPGISREDLSQAVQDIEVLISRLSTKNHWSIFGRDFFQTILSENAANKCKMVIARIVGGKQTRNARRGRSVSVKTEEFLKNQGLDMETLKFKGNFFIITDKSQAKTETKKKPKPTNEVNIERVRSELAGEEVKMAVTQPMKETVTAGKAVIGLGARLGRWFSSLVH